MQINNLDIKVQRIFKLENSESLKAFVDICINDVLEIKGLRVMDGKNGLFVSMPRQKSKDNRWFDRVKCLSKELYEHISDEVLTSYKAELMVNQN